MISPSVDVFPRHSRGRSGCPGENENGFPKMRLRRTDLPDPASHKSSRREFRLAIRDTAVGMNYYLITHRISRDRALDELIGRKKIGIPTRCCTTANRVSPRCSWRRLSTADDNKSPPVLFRSAMRDAMQDTPVGRVSSIISCRARIRAYPRVLSACVREVDECNSIVSHRQSRNEREKRRRGIARRKAAENTK